MGLEINSKPFSKAAIEGSGDDVASDATDPEMPAFHALVTPATQSARAVLDSLNAKP